MDTEHDISKIPDTQKAVFKKAYEGKSRTAAVKAKCLECCCFQREEVRNCTVRSCPLWMYRPFSGKSTSKPPSKTASIEKNGKNRATDTEE